MSAELIDNLVSQEALNSMKTLAEASSSVNEKYSALLETTAKFADKINSTEKTFSAISELIKELNQNTENLNKVQKEEIDILLKKEKLTQQVLKTEQEKIKLSYQQEKQYEKQAKAQKDAQKAGAEYIDIEKEKAEATKNFNEMMKKSNEEYLKQTKDFSNSAEQVNALFENINDTVNNVDVSKAIEQANNYKEAVNLAGFEINKITSLQEQLNERLKDGVISQEQYNAANKDLTEKQKEYQVVLDDLNSKFKTTSESQKEMIDSISAEAFASLSPELREQTRNLLEMNIELENVRTSIKDLTKEFKDGKIEQIDYISLLSELKTHESDLSEAIKNTSKELQLNKEIAKSSEGSYDNLSAKYSLMKIQINAMGEAEGQNVEVKRNLEKEADALYAKMNELQKGTGKYVLQVGNYEIAANSLRAELMNLKNQMSELELAGEQNSATYQDLVKKSADLKMAINLATKEIEYAAMKGKNLTGLVEQVKLVTYGFTAWKGASQLLGIQNESLEKTMQKIVTITMTLNAVQQIQNSLKEGSITRLKIIRPLTDAWGKSTQFLTVNLGLSNLAAKALMGTLTLGLAVAIPFVINLVEKLIDKNKEAAEAQKKLAEEQKAFSESVAQSVAPQIVTVETLSKKWKDLGDNLEAKKKFVKENKEEFNKLGVEVNNVADAENLLVGNKDAFIAALKMKAMAVAGQNLATKEYEKLLTSQMEAEQNSLKIKDLITGKQKAELSFDNKAISSMIGGRTKLKIQSEANAIAAEKLRKENGKLYDEQEKAMNRVNEISTTAEKNMSAAEKAFVEAGIKMTNSNKKSTSETKKELEKLANLYAEYQKTLGESEAFRLNKTAEINKEIASDTKKTFEERESAHKEYINNSILAIETQRIAEKEAVDKKYKDELISKETAEAQKKLIDDKAEYEKQKRENEGKKFSYKILEERYNYEKEKIKEKLDFLSMSEQEELTNLDKKYAEQLSKAIGNEKEIKKITEQHEKEKYDIAIKYKRKEFEFELKMLEESLLAFAENEEIKIKIKKQIEKAKQNLEEFSAKTAIEIAKAEINAKKTIYEKFNEYLRNQTVQSIMEAFSMASNIAKEYYASQLQEIDEKDAREKEKYDEDIQRISDLKEQGILSSEEADARKRILAEGEKQREQDIAKQKREIQLKQAKWEKANALIQAVISTALAVTQALPNVILAAIIGALGAVQIAQIASKQIPAYAEGTDFHKGGLAIVGDAFTSEAAITPQGKIYKTPAVPTLIDLPFGTKILPDFDEAMKRFAFPVIPSYNDKDQTMQLILKEEFEKNRIHEINMMNRTDRLIQTVSSLNNNIAALRANQHYANILENMKQYKAKKQ